MKDRKMNCIFCCVFNQEKYVDMFFIFLESDNSTFDEYIGYNKGKQTTPEFILNGGIEMKTWVNNELRRLRQGIAMTAKNKSETGMQNQHIKTHSKDGIDVRPSKEHSRTVDTYNAAVTESLKRINELISKI
jgi:hypothetical protein